MLLGLQSQDPELHTGVSGMGRAAQHFPSGLSAIHVLLEMARNNKLTAQIGEGTEMSQMLGLGISSSLHPHVQPTVFSWVLLQKPLLRAGCLHVNNLSLETEFLLLKYFYSLCTAHNCTDQLKHLLKWAEKENKATKELSRNFYRQQHLS